MKRNALALAALLLLPAAAMASQERDISVDVHVNTAPGCGWDDAQAWIDFRPDRGAFVALYAAYSDGSVRLVFPAEGWRNHWVEPGPPYSIGVFVPRGLRLESVQAVASRHWFDPSECWVTAAPLHHGEVRPNVTVVTHSRYPVFAWNFTIVWGSTHRHAAPRISHRHPLVVAAAGRDAALPRTNRWTSGGRPDLTQVKVKAAPGTKSSKTRGEIGEPKRRSRS